MLVAGNVNTSPALSWWRRGAWASVSVLLIAVLSLTPYMSSSSELVRMRNALLVEEDISLDSDWTPANIPSTFMLERGPVDPFFVDVVNRLNLATLPDDWTRALAISHHLLGSSPTLNGGAIKADLRRTYLRIVNNGEGYCGDFVDVFTAIALAAGIPVRSWAFSFDGFGGHGHVWPEIWNRQLGKWQLVGIFNNYYFFETAGMPMSALDFHRALSAKSTGLKLAPLDPGSRVGWMIEAKAWDYYRNGQHQWYMWWGNNVFTYDRTRSVRLLSGISQSLSQLGSIVEGVYPKIRILDDPINRPQVGALVRLRMHLIFVTVVGLVSLFCLIASIVGGWIAHRRYLIGSA